MSLVQEWKKLIADEEEKLEKINRQIIVNNEEKEMAKIREEFTEGWRKVMSERIVKYLHSH